MSAHEQAVIDAFNSFVRAKALEAGKGYHEFALDGQDRDAGADYLISDKTRFALIEFKYQEASIAGEARKVRRKTLCQLLEREVELRKLHDNCHFICWSNSSHGIDLNIYRHEVCNSQIFGPTAALRSPLPHTATRVAAERFASEFLSQSSRSLTVAEFEGYLNWLLTKASVSTLKSVELLARDHTSESCAVITFPNVRAAFDWLQSW